MARVAQRVREGGHNIPPDVIERRYWRGLQNLFQLFMSTVNDWSVYDNNNETRLIASSDGTLDYDAYMAIISRIPIDNQLKILEFTESGDGKTNWEQINRSIERAYEDMLQWKMSNDQPLVVSAKGKPRLVPASDWLNPKFRHMI